MVIEKIQKLASTPGQFVVVEGPEGTGKTTLVKAMAEYCRTHGLNGMLVSQPGTTLVGQGVRQILTEGHLIIPSWVSMRLLEAARLDVILKSVEWIKKLEACDQTVLAIGDRHVASTDVLQRHLGHAPAEEIRLLEAPYEELLPVKYTIILDAPAEVSMARVGARPAEDQKMFDIGPKDQFERIRDGYLNWYRSNQESSFLVDASGSVEETWAQVEPLFKETCAFALNQRKQP